MSKFSISIEPDEGSTNPPIIFNKVVFPQPDGPKIATKSPENIS